MTFKKITNIVNVRLIKKVSKIMTNTPVVKSENVIEKNFAPTLFIPKLKHKHSVLWRFHHGDEL